MAKISQNEIQDITQDWGSDPANGLPFSGKAIQKFIKDTFNTKAGYFYYDTSTNRYLVFADTESKDKYLDNPTMTELVLGAFDAPFNYSAEINLISDAYVAIPTGTTGNYIEFTFDVKNKNGASVGEDVVCTYTVMRGSLKKTITQKYRSGTTVRFNIDNYLDNGTNRITIGIVGQTTLAATTIGITYQVVNLELTDETDITTVYDLGRESKIMSIPFTISGSGVKTVEWYLDGVQLPFDRNVDEVVDTSSSRIKYITLSDISRGTHYVEFRAYSVIDEERFYSKTLHRDIIIENSGVTDKSTLIALAYDKNLLEDTTIKLSQYLAYDLRFAIYNPYSPESTEVEIYLNDDKLTTLAVQNGIENTYSIVPTTTGEAIIRIVAAETESILNVNVNENTMGIGEITAGLELGFSSIGRSNSEPNRGTWSGNGHSATLSGVNYTQTSGWINNKLLLSSGAAITFDYAPLNDGSTEIGKTLEFEFASSNVSDDTAILCDMMDTNGSGIIITASEAKIVSRGGVQLSVKYKSEENTRISFVINRATGVTNKGLVFIYVNGVISGATNFGATDDFISDVPLIFNGTNQSEVLLKQIRIYNTTLSSDQILNNYILYRDTTAEMLDVFDRNNIYEDDSLAFSVDKLMGQLPVMVVTGDIPALENTTNKNLQITVDIDYYNLQEPSKSFTMKNAAMRPQGTSSMLYPKKNFRIYTKKLDNTVLTVNGQTVTDKLYSFKGNAQPVDCWCLKADFAESSGTHNTGVARLWNELLVNATLNGEYVFRTEAQKKAFETGYPYDVRTTVDGFPILMFYRRDENSELIFIGKYNFNNDKSTESVFGFTGIPGFDNGHMQCWEILNNGDALALFTDVSDFDSRWKDAYESRYPDISNPNTEDLKAFATWVNSMRNNPTEFATQKWDHMQVYLMAAYYVYLMRFGAVDQVVKNAMLTSEDGEHFYFINYDNDTVNGLRNNGVLAFDPTIDRQSLDPATGGLAYAYAGHDSVLWNLLEADEEFMQLVKDVDNALYTAGLRYDNVINIFDNEQSDKWNERIYNQDAQYKYIGPYTDAGNNNLLMLQGKRQSHRRWWLSNRFSLYDSKFVSGDFKGKAFEFKVINNTEPGWYFTIKAGKTMDYGYGVYNPIETGISLNEGESHQFTIQQTLNIGDPVRIYSAANLMSVDLNNILSRLSNVELNNVYNETLGTKLKELILGNGVTENTILTSISSISKAKRLEKLDIRGCKAITSIDLSELYYLKTVLAERSGLTGIELAKGAGITKLSLPSSMQVLQLDQLTSLGISGLTLENNGANIRSFTIMNCPSLSRDINLPLTWLANKVTPDNESSFYMDNVLWTNIEPDDFLTLCTAKMNGVNLTLKGKVKLTTSSQEIIDTITEAFGSQVFRPGNELYVNAPDAIYLAGPDSILEGESAQFTAAVFSEYYGTVTYSIASGSRTGTTIDANTGLLTSVETGYSSSTLTIRALHRPTQGSSVYADKKITIRNRTYPSGVSIDGTNNPSDEVNIYRWQSTNSGFTGEYTVEWELSGDITEYVQMDYSDNEKCRLVPIKVATDTIDGTLSVRIRRKFNSSIASSATKNLQMLNPDILMTNITNPEVMTIMYTNGLAANETYMTKDEASIITEVDLQPGTSQSTSIFYGKNIKHFEEFKYFTNLQNIPVYCFSNCILLTTIHLPEQIENIKTSSFNNCSRLNNVIIPTSVISLEGNCFYYCNSLKEIKLSDNLKTIGYQCFYNCLSLTSIILPESLNQIGSNAFRGTKIETITIPKFLAENSRVEFNDLFSNNLKEIIFEGQSKYAIISYTSESGGCANIENIVFIEDDNWHWITDEGFVVKRTTSDQIQIEYILQYKGDLETLTFPKEVTSCYFPLFKPNTLETSNFKKIIFQENIKTILSSDYRDETIKSNYLAYLRTTFTNLESFEISADNQNIYIDQQGLVYSIDNKTLYSVSPQIINNIIVSDETTQYAKYAFTYSKIITCKCNNTNLGLFYNCKELVSVDFSSSSIIRNDLFSSSKLFSYCSSLSEIIIPDGIEYLHFYDVNEVFYKCTSLKKIPCEISVYRGSSIFAGSGIETITINQNASLEQSYIFSGCKSLKEIKCFKVVAPTINSTSFGTSNDSYAGRDTYNTGENILYVPANATGYNTSYWLDPLQNADKCGFTISYTL